MARPTLLFLALLTLCLALPTRPAAGLDAEHRAKAQQAMERGFAYLRETQQDDGAWTPRPGPAVTALAITPMLQHGVPANEPHVAKALQYILDRQKPDGGIYEDILPNYNTAISVSALALVPQRPAIQQAIANAQKFLGGLQWHGQEGPDGKIVNADHPFYGGAGYGGEGRPDMSNTQFMLQALHDSGLDPADPIFQRALVFINRCQGHASNDMFADKIENDGGFIYSTSISKELVGVPESKANPELMDEAKNGAPVSGLRTYGSITYAGFKSYLYADLAHDDPRVQAVWDWVRNNYTLDRNPGLPDTHKLQGLYYYYMTFGRALDAWGEPTIDTTTRGSRDWANDLIDQLVSRQRDDGSWVNEADRWMESDPNLVTAYALLALQSALQ